MPSVDDWHFSMSLNGASMKTRASSGSTRPARV
jgi:hypothetical protein